MKEKIISVCTELKDVIDGIGAVQTAWGLIVACALIIAFVFCVFTFTNRVNKSTKAQVQRFQREGKYLPATYIELNDSTEYLRYFRTDGNIVLSGNTIICFMDMKGNDLRSCLVL